MDLKGLILDKFNFGMVWWSCNDLIWDIYMQCGRHFCLWACISNVKCMYTSVPGHIVDSSEFIAVSCAYELICICGIYVVFGRHVDPGTYMAITCEVYIAVVCIFVHICKNVGSIVHLL